ncbi:MAG: hypothetical protein GY786_21290, partial [Proteobacteria bacterium]|nr:hypothetical protein [Pseudomonadota bacterium]
KKRDLFVLFGELFSRGYANGLVEEAKAAGMTIVGITVGRRDRDNILRPLNPEELEEAENNLGGKIINIPLWAGFDMDAKEGEPSPTEQLSKLKVKDWENFDLDWEIVNRSKTVGTSRFIESLQRSMAQIKELVTPGSNLFFAHTMAGGIPRAKALLLLTNHTVKGQGKRYLSSQKLWESNIGKLIRENMQEVTANTLKYLINETAEIRKMVSEWGGNICYTAYGYHGTEILIDKKYQWQSYTPYLPGWGKKELENIATDAMKSGIQTVVFNCPEIRTNSSDIFSGVELSLYPLLSSMLNENGGDWARSQYKLCSELLTDDISLENLPDDVDQYHCSENMQNIYLDFENWPRHNSVETSEMMLQTSDKTMKHNLSKKETITHHLSELVVQTTGSLIFNHAMVTKDPVLWVGHDIIAKELNIKHQK